MSMRPKPWWKFGRPAGFATASAPVSTAVPLMSVAFSSAALGSGCRASPG